MAGYAHTDASCVRLFSVQRMAWQSNSITPTAAAHRWNVCRRCGLLLYRYQWCLLVDGLSHNVDRDDFLLHPRDPFLSEYVDGRFVLFRCVVWIAGACSVAVSSITSCGIAKPRRDCGALGSASRGRRWHLLLSSAHKRSGVLGAVAGTQGMFSERLDQKPAASVSVNYSKQNKVFAARMTKRPSAMAGDPSTPSPSSTSWIVSASSPWSSTTRPLPVWSKM